MRAGLINAMLLGLFGAGVVCAGPDDCSVCGATIERTAYFWADRVEGGKRRVCEKCSDLSTVCYLCGVPAKINITQLPDGRVLCARDVKRVVLDEAEGQRICQETKEALDRQFSRFISFPDTGVDIEFVDRVDIQSLFRFAGNDFACPVVWGYTASQTNDGRLTHNISLLTGLQPATLRATCAHEFGHVWVNLNVPRPRRQRMDQDAVEGFCELVSYLLMDAQNAEVQKAVIRSNAYTRGQIRQFLDAGQRFGFNDVVEWMKYGVDERLMESDPDRIRNVELPRAGTMAAPSLPPAPASPPAPPTLTLLGVTWSPARPVALINNRTFEPNETATIRLGDSNLTVRCVTIRERAVVIEVAGSGEQRTLRLKED